MEKKKGILKNGRGSGSGRAGRTWYSRCWILMVCERTSRPVLERRWRWRTEDRFVDGGGTWVCNIQAFFVLHLIQVYSSYFTSYATVRDTRIMPSLLPNFVMWNQEIRQKSCNPFVMCGRECNPKRAQNFKLQASTIEPRHTSSPASSSVPHILPT